MCSEFWIGRARPSNAERDRDARSGLAVGLGLLVVYVGGLAVSLLVTPTVITTGAVWYFVAGLAIAAVGQGLRLRAVHESGASFTFKVQVAAGQTVVDPACTGGSGIRRTPAR